jgi:hypothetical protein
VVVVDRVGGEYRGNLLRGLHGRRKPPWLPCKAHMPLDRGSTFTDRHPTRKRACPSVERLLFKPTREAAFWCAALRVTMHHGQSNAYAAYALLSLLIVLVVFLLFQTS